jgi:phage terminase large subunit-like protein
MGTVQTDHVAEALEYAQDVLAGVMPACKWVKAACRRQLDDLDRWANDPTWLYEWRPELADRVIRFVELLPHVKDGANWAAGAPIRLVPAQKFSLACVFGWVRKSDGRRRFRTVYEEVPRKNAKTTKLAPIGLYMLVADGEMGAEVYSAATKEEQARIVFNIAKRMAQLEPEFRALFSLQMFRKALAVRETGSTFQPLAADGDSLDGLNVSCALIDELHAHKTRAVYDVLDSGRGSRAQPLLWAITTAGSNRAGVCYDVRGYLTKILNAVLKRHGGLGYDVKGEVAEDESFWGIIYTIDDGDDYFAESTWRKANPLYGISVDPEDLRRMATVAQVQAQALNEFLTKRLNVWVNADSAWMNMLQWDACADSSLREADFAGERCIAALDAAFKKDLFAKVKIFRRGEHYYAFGRYYMNEDVVRTKGNEHLEAWAREGWLRTTPGNVLDIEAVREELLGAKDGGEPKGDLQRFELGEVPFDPAQLTQFATECIEQGVPMVEIRPTVLNFSAAMKELEALVASKRLHHTGDPVLAWAIANVVCHRDAKDNIYPRKDDPTKKIDPAIALIMALSRWLSQPPKEGDSFWQKEAA